ncbi:MAG: hypothetical protein FJ257_05620 [Phycisphaerae bacterium]|nr:hypothetical protein [Phycisphaerae bacterium]
MHVDRTVASLTVAACLGMASVASGQAPAFTGPLPYQGIQDSPYFSSGQVCYALETFPQGAISVPGFSFSPNGAAIVPGVGVPPGGFVLQASSLGVIQMNFAPDASTGQYPTQVGFIWTGGGTPEIGSQLTVTVISGGSQAVSQQYTNLPYNDPALPEDNRFFGVTWSTGVQQVRLAFNPFSPTIPNQVDDIQFSLASKVTAIEPASANYDAAGGTGSSAVTLNGAGCGWTATTTDPWISITSGSGFGNGTVQYSVAANTGAARTGSISVSGTGGGLSISIAQAASGECAITGINPTSASASAAGGPGSFAVTVSNATCTWSASTSDAWITLTTGSGTGDGNVAYAIAENTSTDARTGTISVGGFAFTVTQSGVPCAVTAINPTSASASAAGGPGSFAVTTNGATCAWSATTGDAWITLTTASGTGNGTVGYTVAENTVTIARTGTITVEGLAFTVTQDGAACAVTGISPTSASASAAGGPGSFAVTTNGAECSWSATTGDAWITLTTGSGTGDGNVAYAIAANTSTDARTGTISVGGLAFTVTQGGVPCAVTAINPTSASASAAGGPGSFAVTTNGATCAWSATTGDAWITLTTASGTGNGTVGYTVAENTVTIARTGTITVEGLTFTVTQDGAACAVVEISPTSASYAPAADTGSFLVTTNGPTCPWSASTTDPWITVTTPSGTGSSLVEYAVAENTGAESRTGTITVGGLDFTITQSSPQAAVFVIPDQPYLSLTDSPFFGQGISCFEVEFYPSGGTAVDGVTYAPGEIVPGVGVAPGGFVLQSVGGQVGFTIDAAIAAGGQPPMAVGIVFTGGPASSATVTVTDPNGVQAIAILPVTANDPTNPSDNQFVGVEWFNGVSQIAVSFDPPGGTYQFDQLQFNIPSEFCQTGQPDFNGDGWNDLVVQNPSTGETGVQLLLDGEAAGYLSTGQTAGAEWRARALGFWGQGAPGRPSICFRSEVSGVVGNWLLDGPDFTSAYVVNPTVSLAWRVSASGDFDLDGIDDLVWQNLSTGQTGVWYFGANGQPASFVSMPTQPPAGWLCEGSADFNDDGRSDLLWRNQTSGQMGVWYLGGADGLAIQNIGLVATAGSPSWAIVGLSDLDSDGVPDLLWQQVSGGTFGVWYMGFDPQTFGLSVTAIEVPTLGVSNAWRIRG